ncbi:hypothetical protein, partial [Nostoc sp. 'Peltigera membranacea cyanobiont' 210A]|uniref:hypothetical protein n=1 Tax=Nostoc sp. 'Peltigera membranacea cyanobiont' 210A TaxID=2014529 RepID=UPI001CB9558E
MTCASTHKVNQTANHNDSFVDACNEWRVIYENTARMLDFLGLFIICDLRTVPGFLTHSVGRGGRGVWGVWGVWG